MNEQNHELVGRALNTILREALAPYVARELMATFQDHWWQTGVLGVLYEEQKRNLPAEGSYAELTDAMDVQCCLILMDLHWRDIFSKKLSRNHYNWVKELNTVRNQWAHTEWRAFDDSYTARALDTMARMCEQLDDEYTIELRNLWREKAYGDAAGSRNAAQTEIVPTASRTNTGIMQAPIGRLKSWREVMRPHPDVAEGRYRQAEFAADLAQVARGEGSAEYLDPVEFFSRTYVTEGMKGLLSQALRRLGLGDGEPVIQLKTSFGGGKTHSMLALYHLFHGKLRPAQSENVQAVLATAEMGELPKDVQVAVIVGTALNPAKAKRPPNMPGLTIHTLWGEIAAQLAYASKNPKLYDYVKEADKRGVSPGSEALRDMLDECGACLILVDELVAYAKKLYGIQGLPAGSFDNLISFIQELTEAARASRRSMVVASLPESEIEVGGDAGQQVLTQIEHTFGRMESIWKPVAANESFEVVRRRLFLPCQDEAARDAICAAFSEMYRTHGNDFPVEAKDVSYRQEMVNCYPIHPEFFHFLYDEWATIERFQKTRGVLRLMAGVAYHLWINADASCMIMPGSIPLAIPQIRDELIRYLPENWNAIVDSEIDGRDSEPMKLDQGNSRYGALMAARRVARTIFLGSAPSVREQNIRGVEESHIRLGVVQPQEENDIAVFGDVLGKLKSQLSYLYTNDTGTRCWYDNRPTLRKLVQDLENRIASDDVEREIEMRLRKWKSSPDFGGIHICPSSADVPDEQRVRLVILPMTDVHERGQKDTAALEQAKEILEMRGTSPRQYKNMLVFLAPDKGKMFDLQKIVRRFKAWQLIRDEAERRNLDQAQIREADASIQQVEANLIMRLSQAYAWVLAPDIDAEENIKDVYWNIAEISCTQLDNVQKCAERLTSDDNLIRAWGPSLLKMELDQWLWKERDAIEIKQLWEYLASYCYLPRLRDVQVLLDTIRKGVMAEDGFALAEMFDGSRYTNLKLRQEIEGEVPMYGLVVKKEAAEKQIAEDERKRAGETEPLAASGSTNGENADWTGEEKLENPATTKSITSESPRNRHFSMDVPLDSVRINKEVSTYMSEVLSHLLSLPGTDAAIRLDVDIHLPNGTPPDVVTTVSENCRTLKVESFRFEE